MSTLRAEARVAIIRDLTLTNEMLSAELADGRVISVPLAWYPRLLHGSPEERRNWRLIGDGEGVHWPDLDEDISADNLVLGKPSGESQVASMGWKADHADRQTLLRRSVLASDRDMGQ